MAQLEKSKMLKVEGEVYCLTHTCVHDDTLDPYGYGYPSCLKESEGTGMGVTREMVHRTLYYRARKGDLDG